MQQRGRREKRNADKQTLARRARHPASARG